MGSVPVLWQHIQAQKKSEQANRLARFPNFRLQETVLDSQRDVSGIPLSNLPPRRKEIVVQDVTSLAAAIRERRYTAVEVTEAFCHAAVIAHELTNCLTEVFLEEGLARAAELDKHLQETGTVIGPLHGVPISIKDMISIRGQDTSAGYVGWAFKSVATGDAVMVDILRQAGAIIYVKTANPQTLLSVETHNNVFGRTSNPFNRTLTPGGSSGGASALTALHGSPLGVGTDIGGSIRVPAAHTGLYGLKPSSGRLPRSGLKGSAAGRESIRGSIGPLATSARDLALFCQAVLEYEPWLVDPDVLPMPWKKSIAEGDGQSERLSLAILWDDGVVAPHPPIVAALKEAEAALVAAGHEVIRWEPLDDHQYAWDLLVKLYFLDGGEEYRETMRAASEPEVPQTKWILSQIQDSDRQFTIAETFALNVERERFRKRLADHWNATRARTSTGRAIDAVLSPVAATLAPPHDTTRYWGYTSHWNLADYAAVVFPVGVHRASDVDVYERLSAGRTPRNPVEELISNQWDPEIYENAPISLQLVGRRLNEEKLLHSLRVVEEATKLRSP